MIQHLHLGYFADLLGGFLCGLFLVFASIPAIWLLRKWFRVFFDGKEES